MNNQSHTIRVLLYRILGFNPFVPVDTLIDVMRKSVWFMGKVATVSIEDITVEVTAYATVIDCVNQILGNQLPISSCQELLYKYHLMDIDPHKAYGLLSTNNTIETQTVDHYSQSQGYDAVP